MATRITAQERTEAIQTLRELLAPGDTVYTILRHRSNSGMSRVISLVVLTTYEGVDRNGAPVQKLHPRDISWLAAKAIGWGYDEKREGIRVSGCGMDMGFHVVYTLARVLFRDLASEQLTWGDAGYSLDHRWL